MKIGSLFAGIGGLELGLEWAGLGHTVWQAEQDEFCRAVLAKHWPEAKRFEDVREVSGATAEPVDLICGGFPCQDISLAGKNAGLDGARSGLWWEFHRIVRDLRPRLVVVENVSALRSRGLGAVLGSLAEIGYDARWDCIPAQSIGAPHRRDRLFVVAWRVPDAGRDEVREQPERGQGAPQAGDEGHEEPGHLGEAMADAQGEPQREPSDQANPFARGGEARAQLEHRGGADSDSQMADSEGWPPRPDDLHAWGRVQADSQPAICRVAYGIPHRTHRLRSLGNAVVPQVAQVIGEWIKGAGLA